MKYVPDPTWWTRCLRSLRFDSDAYANLHRVHVTNEVKGNKSKGFKFSFLLFHTLPHLAFSSKISETDMPTCLHSLGISNRRFSIRSC